MWSLQLDQARALDRSRLCIVVGGNSDMLATNRRRREKTLAGSCVISIYMSMCVHIRMRAGVHALGRGRANNGTAIIEVELRSYRSQ